MAYVDMNQADIISGQPISKSTFGDIVVGNFDQHEIDINALESTVNAAGSTAAGNAALSTRLGTQITTTNTVTAHLGTGVGVGANVTTGSATSQLTDLRSRVTAAEGVNTTQTTNISTINTNLGTWSGGTAISRLTTLEGRGKGSWKASNGTQDFAVGIGENILINTVVGTPVGITNNANGTWTVNQTGFWIFTGVFDLNMATAPPSGSQEWIIQITGPNGTIAGHQFAWPTNAYTAGSASGGTFLNSGQVVTFSGVWYRSAGDSGGPFTLADANTNRATFSAVCVA